MTYSLSLSPELKSALQALHEKVGDGAYITRFLRNDMKDAGSAHYSCWKANYYIEKEPAFPPAARKEFKELYAQADKDMQLLPGMRELMFPEAQAAELKQALRELADSIPKDRPRENELGDGSIFFGSYRFPPDEFIRTIGEGRKFEDGSNVFGQAAGNLKSLIKKFAGDKRFGEAHLKAQQFLERFGAALDEMSRSESAADWQTYCKATGYDPDKPKPSRTGR